MAAFRQGKLTFKLMDNADFLTSALQDSETRDEIQALLDADDHDELRKRLSPSMSTTFNLGLRIFLTVLQEFLLEQPVSEHVSRLALLG